MRRALEQQPDRVGLIEHDAVQLDNVRVHQLPQRAEVAPRSRHQPRALVRRGAHQTDPLECERRAVELHRVDSAKGAAAEPLPNGEPRQRHLQLTRVRPRLP